MAEFLPRSTAHTASQIPHAIVTITKLGGMLKIAETASPAHTDTTLITVEIVIARIGRAVTMIAVAAGVTTSANSSSVPTASTAIVTAIPNSTMNSTDKARTGTPLASATCALTDANSSGRKTNTTVAARTTSSAVNISSC